MPVFSCNGCLDDESEQPCTLVCGEGVDDPKICPWGGATVPVWRRLEVKE